MILALRDEISNDNLSFAEAKADAFLFYAPGRRATGPISAGVTPIRAASAGKAGVGPERREPSKEQGKLALAGESLGESARTGDVHPPLAIVQRDGFEMSKLG